MYGQRARTFLFYLVKYKYNVIHNNSMHYDIILLSVFGNGRPSLLLTKIYLMYKKNRENVRTINQHRIVNTYTILRRVKYIKI